MEGLDDAPLAAGPDPSDVRFSNPLELFGTAHLKAIRVGVFTLGLPTIFSDLSI